MAHPVPLNPEPSLPAEREEQYLPPKSYVDATEENLTNGSKSDQLTPGVYAGQGEDFAPRSPRRNMHKKSGSLRVNGHAKDKKGAGVVIEKYQDRDGEHLVSLRPGWNSEWQKQRTNSELLSGRKAGARWEQSQYVDIPQIST